MSATAAAARRSERAVVVGTFAVAAAAWIGLLLLGAGGSGHHHSAGQAHQTTALFLATWLLMIAAMMLPASTQFVTTVHRLVRRRDDRRGLLVVAVLGYTLPWAAIGLLARWVGVGLDALRQDWAWLAARPWLVPTAALMLAGAYQFAPVAVRCLQQCRNPAGFVVRGWHGIAARRDLARIGVAYGWSCVGCCWALMAVMVVGSTSLLLMAVLATIMVAERRIRGAGPVVGGLLLYVAAMSVLTQGF
jgi:predicted metal-binding membrane protein